jgi:hypothetical protein
MCDEWRTKNMCQLPKHVFDHLCTGKLGTRNLCEVLVDRKNHVDLDLELRKEISNRSHPSSDTSSTSNMLDFELPAKKKAIWLVLTIACHFREPKWIA